MRPKWKGKIISIGTAKEQEDRHEAVVQVYHDGDFMFQMKTLKVDATPWKLGV